MTFGVVSSGAPSSVSCSQGRSYPVLAKSGSAGTHLKSLTRSVMVSCTVTGTIDAAEFIPAGTGSLL